MARVRVVKKAGNTDEPRRDWERAKEVKTVFSDEEANNLLSTGKWVIADAGRSHLGDGGFNCKPSYMMIRVG